MKTFLKFFLLVLVVLLGVAGLGIYWTYYRTLPDYNTTLTLEELQEEVRVHWDHFGIPHIYAKNKHDLYFTLGYVHAQDRLWQMTLTQLASEGRLAEFLGKELVPADIFQRTLGFWRTAQKIEAGLADSTRHILQSYADGVNAFTGAHLKELPLEFALVDMTPLEWTPTHSLALARLMAWELNIAWKNELTLAYLGQKMKPEQLQELLPDNEFLSRLQEKRIPSDFSGQDLLGLLEGDLALRKVLGAEGFSIGSNAWAINAEKSSTGAPVLAGDPHLGLSMPGKWYETHLHLDGKNLSGATLAGAPIVVLGQNDFLGWSLTNVMIDDADFFIEAVNPENSNQYVLDTLAGDPLYEKFELQREIIKIKNGHDTTFTRKLTRHGPVISEIYPDKQLIGGKVITMKWTAYNVSHETDALLGINWTQSFEEFQRHLPHFKVPGQNIVYADKAGNIGLFTLGAIPIRAGNPVLFRRGWNPADDWQGYIPFEELPKTINPGSGWVANANNPTQPNDYPYYLSIYWEPDSRYERIRQYLTQNEQLTPQAFQAMQLDPYSHYAREMTGIILPILKRSGQDFQTVISYLENWDYRYETSEASASIMDTFVLKLSANIFRDELGDEAYSNFIRFSGLPARIVLNLMRENSSFFDDVTTEIQENKSDIIIQSMKESVAFLESKLSKEPFEWHWENLHTLTLKPLLFGEAADRPDANPVLKLVVNNLMNKGPYAVRGNKMSINNGEYRWSDPYEMVLGPSIRRIVDFSDLSKTLSITPTGQSGNMLSEYYGDQTESWLNGQYKFVYQDSSLFEETVYQTMLLEPGDEP